MKISRFFCALCLVMLLPCFGIAADITLPKGVYSPNTHLMTLPDAEESARLGDQHTMAHYHETGKAGTRQDHERSAKWCHQSALQGYPDAQFDMGRKYANGQGVSRGYGKAYGWYFKAAGQDYADAMFALGVMYGTGEGIEKDLDRAANWYKKAVALGNRDALTRLRQVR